MNDSLNKCGSHKDRHANIGTGYINLDTLTFIAKAKMFEKVPKILETPQPDERNTYRLAEISELLDQNFDS